MAKTYTREKPLITIEGVSKSLSGKLILRDIGGDKGPFIIYDITRPNMIQGQTLAVVGASGSGKSTLFKLLSGIYAPTTGSIKIPDTKKPDNYVPVRGGDVGFVQQTYPISRNQTVFQMLMDAAAQGRVEKTARQALVNSYLEEWGLINQRFLSKLQLSGGQRQRVAIIEQLLCSHHFMLFDEPFSGLDVKNVEDVKRSFQKISTSNELNTIIFSTHDTHLAVELADIIIVIGFEKDHVGKPIPGGTIIKEYDLMDMGLAWTEYGSAHREVSLEIQNIIKTN